MRGTLALAVAAVTASLVAALPAAGQPGATAGGVDETTPFQCWWRSGSGAIRLGEVVEVTLTCAVLERDDLRAVPDESRLGVAAIQMAPFEIVGGDHPPDLRAAGRRLFEYRYRLRIIDADVIGRDVKLPPLSIPYRVESRVGASTLAGRDLVHLLPQLVVRVVSQVPADATDIRDAGDVALGRVDALRFRASGFRLTAVALAVLAAAFAISAAPAAVRRFRRGSVSAGARLSDRAVLTAAARRLEQLTQANPAGELDAEALADAHHAARIVAAVAAGAGVRQAPLVGDAATPEGRLVAEGGLRRSRTAVTANVTGETVARVLESLPLQASATHRARLEELREALDLLTRAQYGADPAVHHPGISASLQRVRAIALELARERRWSGARSTASLLTEAGGR